MPNPSTRPEKKPHSHGAGRRAGAAPPLDESFARPALAIFLAALAARAIHLAQMRGTPFFSVLIGDSRGYDEWARRLAGGDWIGGDVFYQAPLYPYFMGAVYAIAGPDPFVVRVVQALLGSLAAVALGYAGALLFSRRAGIISGAVLAAYPAAIFFDGLIQKSSLDLFFTCAALVLIALIVRGTDRTRLVWCLLGVVVAALSLTRENALLLAAVLLMWAAVRRSAVAVGMFVAGLVIVLAPVVLRNAAVGGGFYLTTSQLGSNFYIGNNPNSDGTYAPLRAGRGDPKYERADATDLAQQATGRTLTPGEVSSFWLDRALRHIRDDPGWWWALMARKAALLINTTEMLDTESQQSHAEWSSVLALTSPIGRFGILVPMALVGMLVAWPRWRELWILYALLAAYAASVVLFFVMARYRHPMLPLLILFASAGLVGAARFVRTARRRDVVAAGVVAVLGIVAANQPLLSDDLMRAISEHNLGTTLLENGRPDDAIAHYRRALAIDPSYGAAYNNLGITLMSKGDIAGAIAAFEESLRRYPRSADARELLAQAHYDLGTARLAQGNFAGAEQALRETLRLKPQNALAHNNLGIALASMDRLPEAIAEWRRALAIEPALVDAQRNLAMATGAR